MMNKSSIAIVALIALASGFLISWLISNNQSFELKSGLWFGEQARALPQFELVDHHGEKFGNDNLIGKWNLMFFGYTHCPDICPTSLQTMNNMVNAIDDSDVRNAIKVYFISVDPARDKPANLASYVTYFNPTFIGATAEMEKLTTLTRPLGIAHQIHKKSEDDVSYEVDHSGAIVLINPAGEYAGLFSAPHSAQTMAQDLTLIVEHN
jgi:protein SCO1/2